MARSPRGVFPNGGLQGYLDTRRANLATKGRYFCQRPPREYMPEIYCHGKTLRNALRAVWLEAGKTLFGQVATGAQDAGGVDAGAAAASDNDGAVRWESRTAGWCRRCP